MTTPGSLREVQIWIAVARSGGSSSEPPLTEIVAPLGSPSCHSREPQFGQKTQRNRRPLSVSRVQAATVPCTRRKSASRTIAEMPKAENFARMGVTTVVVGNCGGSTLNVAKLFRDVEATNVAINVATLIGHNTVREKAMGGTFDRVPTPEELEKMKSLVDQAMKDGAVGLSTG